MSLPAISIRDLGKMYRLNHQGKQTDSFREAITSMVFSPWRRLKQLRGADETMEEFWALKEVSFDVQPGEVVGIIGRNGAGKSTLLKILSRIVEPTCGEIVLRGRVASLLEVGTGFHPELTGKENIYLNGSILGMKKTEIDAKFDEIVDFAEVEKFLDTPVKRYSSGMYVRLAFAVAAHLDPEILIVDEVLAVGDAEFQKKCLGKMKEVSTGTGRTVLFVSHNLTAVEELCSKTALVQDGQLKYFGETQTAIQTYLSGQHSSTQNTNRLSRTQAIIQRVCTRMRGTTTREPIVHIKCGESFELHAEITTKSRLTRILVGANIEDARNRRVATLWQGFHSLGLCLEPGTHCLECSIPQLNLAPGEYRVSFTLGDDRESLDELQNAITLIVAQTSNDRIRSPTLDHGAWYPEFHWKVTDNEVE